MRKARLLSTVAATLLLTVGIASAQTMNKDEARAESRAGRAAESAGREGGAGHEARRAESQHAKGAGRRPARRRAPRPTRRAHERAPWIKTDKSRPTGRPSTPRATSNGPKANEKARRRPGQQASEVEQPRRAAIAPPPVRAQPLARQLSTEQRSKITTIFRQHKVEPAHLNISVHVGTRVPESVHFYPLPVEVVEIYPEWRGYDYILVGDEILVIDPRTHEIVAILDA